jgi:hypothetical protein
MISFMEIVQKISSWYGIHPNVAKCKITTYIHALQTIPCKRDRDDALRARFAHITLLGRTIGSLTQDDPLPGGNLGTTLTASLSPEAHLNWAKAHYKQIGKALGNIPLPPSDIKQRLLLYGAHSKITHTHCLMALSPSAIRKVDEVVEKISIKIWTLPTSFPTTGLHAHDLEDLGLNAPSIWEDYCGTSICSWTKILDDEGALETTARLPSASGNKVSPLATRVGLPLPQGPPT